MGKEEGGLFFWMCTRRRFNNAAVQLMVSLGVLGGSSTTIPHFVRQYFSLATGRVSNMAQSVLSSDDASHRNMLRARLAKKGLSKITTCTDRGVDGPISRLKKLIYTSAITPQTLCRLVSAAIDSNKSSRRSMNTIIILYIPQRQNV